MSDRPQHSPAGVGTRGAKGQTPKIPVLDAPWIDSRFWILELIVLALFLIRLALTVSFHLGQNSEASGYTTVALFLIPVIFAAVNFGFFGALCTSLWVTALSMPQFFMDLRSNDLGAAWAELMQLVILNVLAILVGPRVTAERRARHTAEAAQEAHLQAEALYRELFDTNNAPILIVNSTGFVADANASAQSVFGISASDLIHADGPEWPANLRLINVVGAHAAGRLLTRLVTLNRHDGGDAVVPADPSTTDDRSEPLALDVDGEVVVYRPSATALEQPGGSIGLQVVFEDVTEETQRHERMEAYAARVVFGQEEERRHIAQELHDGPVQSLIHLCRQIDAVSASSTGGDGVHDLGTIRRTAEETVGELRSIAKGLRPSILDDLGLVASINQILGDIGARSSLETSFGVTGTSRRLPPPSELALFRVTQEALSNIERHAKARSVAVGLDFGPTGIRLLVKDDGIGFDATRSSSGIDGDSLGLPGMAERMHLMGARLQFHSEPGSGTTVDVWVPAKALENGAQIPDFS